MCCPLGLSSLKSFFFLLVCLFFSFLPLVFEAAIEVRVGTHAGKLSVFVLPFRVALLVLVFAWFPSLSFVVLIPAILTPQSCGIQI